MYQLLCRVNVPVSDGHLPDAASGQSNVRSCPCWSGQWPRIIYMLTNVWWSFDVLTFLSRAMGSNRVLLTVVQQVDVLEEFSELYSCNEWNGQMTVDSIVHWQWHCIKQAAIIMHHARLLQAPAECWLTGTQAHRPTHISTHIHYITTLHVDTVFRV